MGQINAQCAMPCAQCSINVQGAMVNAQALNIELSIGHSALDIA
jgi:hypothetical protein